MNFLESWTVIHTMRLAFSGPFLKVSLLVSAGLPEKNSGMIPEKRQESYFGIKNIMHFDGSKLTYRHKPTQKKFQIQDDSFFISHHLTSRKTVTF